MQQPDRARDTDANGTQREGLDNDRRDLTPDKPRDDGGIDERLLVDEHMATGSDLATEDLGPNSVDGGLEDHPVHDEDPGQDAEPDDYEMMLDKDNRDAPLSPDRIAEGLTETPRRGRDDAIGFEPDDPDLAE